MQAYGLGVFIEETCIDWLFWRFPSLVNKQSQTLLQKRNFRVLFKFIPFGKFV